MKRFAPVMAAVVVMMLSGLAVAGPSDSPMVGKWMATSYQGEELPEGAFWVENRDDGTGTLHEGGEEYPYTWTHDQEAGTCTVTADGEEMVYTVVIEGDELTFTSVDDPDDVMVLKRMED